MRAKQRFDEILYSGRQVFFAEGLDYSQHTQEERQRWHLAAKRRGLALATRIVYEPPGFVMRAYQQGHQRPELDLPTEASAPTKFSYLHLFCRLPECENRLKPLELENHYCGEHFNG